MSSEYTDFGLRFPGEELPRDLSEAIFGLFPDADGYNLSYGPSYIIDALEDNGILPLDLVVGVDDSGEELLLHETIPAFGYDPLEALTTRQVLHGLLSLLSERERTVLVHKYGLLDDVDRSNEEIAKILGVKPRRINQIKNRALGKLSRNVNEREL